MKRLAGKFTLLWVALAAVTADQLSKYAVSATMAEGQSVPGQGFFRITYGTNAGGVFGLPADPAFLITLTVVVIVVTIVIYVRYPTFNKALVRVGLGLILGGAIGNLIDRIRYGEVIDFIDIGAWPVFNLADSAIVVGVILIIYYFIFPARREMKASQGADS